MRTVSSVMIVDLNALDQLTDKERRHCELAIYVGYALERAQKFEQRVVYLLALTNARDDPDNHAKFREDVESLSSRKQIELLQRCVRVELISQETADACEKARKGRNEFAHGFYVDHDMHTEEGLDRAWLKVQYYHSLFDQTGALLDEAIMVAVSALGITDQEIGRVQGLVAEIQGSTWA